MLLQDHNSNLGWKTVWEVVCPTPVLRAGTFSRRHLVAQSHVSLNVLQINRMWFLIYYKLGILSSFYTTVEDNLCLLRRICQYLKAWLNTFRSKKTTKPNKHPSPLKKPITKTTLRKVLKKWKCLSSPLSYLITWGRSEMMWLLSIYRFSNVLVYTYYT